MHLKKLALVCIGLTALGIGVVGIFVPLLPTTVFLLIAAACFARSSDRLYEWLLGHRWFGPYIANYRQHRAITRRAKAMTVVVLWATILASLYLAPGQAWIRAVLIGVAFGVTLLMLRLRTMTPEMECCTGAALERRPS